MKIGCGIAVGFNGTEPGLLPGRDREGVCHESVIVVT